MDMRSFNVDMDNLSDLKKLITILQKHRKNLLEKNANFNAIHFGTSKLNLNDIMDIFDFLYNQKYPNLSENNQDDLNYYVYVHCDPLRKLSVKRDIREFLLASKYGVTHMPIYVGKGIGNHCFDLNRNDSHRKIRTTLLNKNTDLMVIKVKDNLSEQEALFEEQKLISFLGLKALNNTGLLTNLQTENSTLEYLQKQFENEFHPKEDRLKQKGFKLLKFMKKWTNG